MGARIWTSWAFVMVLLEIDKMILKSSCDFSHPWAKPHFYHTSATAENIIRHWHSNPLHTGHRWPGQWSTMHPSTPCAWPNLAYAADNGVNIKLSYTHIFQLNRVENWDWRELVTRTIEVTLTPISYISQTADPADPWYHELEACWASSHRNQTQGNHV